MTVKVASELQTLFRENRNKFNEILADELGKHESKLSALLHPYRSDQRATIATVDVEEVSVGDDGSGVAHCCYVEEIYMGCKDMDSVEEQWDSLNFVYLLDQDEVRFENTTKPERVPNEEL